jgi:hypothetical protein
MIDSKSKISSQWEDVCSPLAKKFYFNAPMLFFHEIVDRNTLFEDTNTMLLKDGVLGILPLLAFLSKLPTQAQCSLSIPIVLAPLVPPHLNHFFKYYVLSNDNAASGATEESNLLLFLGSVSPHTSHEILKKQLEKHNSQAKKIVILKNPMEELNYNLICKKSYDIEAFDKNIELIKSTFPLAHIQITCDDRIVDSIDLEQFTFIDTNHFNFFCGQDFLSYFYSFKTQSPVSHYFIPNPKYYKEIQHHVLVKQSSITFYQYTGPSIITPEETDFLSFQSFMTPSPTMKFWDYYSAEQISFAEQLAKKLFEFNIGNNENF